MCDDYDVFFHDTDHNNIEVFINSTDVKRVMCFALNIHLVFSSLANIYIYINTYFLIKIILSDF